MRKIITDYLKLKQLIVECHFLFLNRIILDGMALSGSKVSIKLKYEVCGEPENEDKYVAEKW